MLLFVDLQNVMHYFVSRFALNLIIFICNLDLSSNEKFTNVLLGHIAVMSLEVGLPTGFENLDNSLIKIFWTIPTS